MTEVSWVRSVYLYVMTALSVALVGIGAIVAVVGLVHTIAPDLGHRDTIDRLGIGVANIANEVIDLTAHLGAAGYAHGIHDFGGECTDVEIARIVAAARALGAGTIVGAGGGKVSSPWSSR